MVSKKSLIGIITGTTASGKTALALSLGQTRPDLEIINADSLLVYRGMSIGTAKPTPEELAGVPHHLIDIREPDQAFTAGEFARAATEAIEDIQTRGKRALIVGGTGFYLKALLFGLWEAPAADLSLRERLQSQTLAELYQRLETIDPTSALRIGRADQYRLIRALEIYQLTGKTPSELEAKVATECDPRFRLWILDRNQEELETRIHQRTENMIRDGLVEEYKEVHERFPQARALGAIGYKQVAAYLQGVEPAGRKIVSGLSGLASEIDLATRQLVKQQRTWFKGQTSKIQNAQWFILDRDRLRLEEEFNSLYS